jgi:hypothetical protein
MLKAVMIDTVGRILVTNDLQQAGRKACRTHPYEAVVQELITRVDAVFYDGWPGRPSYQVASGWVRMWLPGTPTTTPHDQLMTVEQLVRKMFPDIGVQPGAASQAQAKGSLPRTEWGEVAEDKPAKG